MADIIIADQDRRLGYI